MTRRDLIIVAVLANIGVLAILFMLAFRTDEEQQAPENNHIAYNLAEETVHVAPATTAVETPAKQPEPVDMIDAALDEEGLTPTPSLITGDDDNFQIIEPETASSDNQKHEKVAEVEQIQKEPSTEHKYVEVTVKRGDALEKIARANGTTVEEVMKANDLKNDRLKIGQVLKVPVGTRKKSTPPQEKKIAIADTKQSPEYYTVKSGDNPWKIAKQFHLKLDELLKLNNLNEEKARNLKVGDTIRVK